MHCHAYASCSEEIYKITFHILESSDEHLYEIDLFQYDWPLYGFELSKLGLKKLYRENAITLVNTKL